MRRLGEHAVVIGGSMGGLLTARVLAERYDRVTVVERDELPAGFEGRRAIPQGRHAHALLPHGQACLETLLPGLCEELVADGAVTCDALGEMRFILGGHQFARPSTGQRSILAGRPFVEGHVRRRVRALPGVTLLDRCDVAGLTTGPDGARVTGVRILRRADGSAEEPLRADLVVAATGRAARVPAWLEAMGHPRPPEQRLRIDVAYASRHLRLPAGALPRDRFVLVGARPELPRTLFLFAQEHGRWILSLGGYGPGHRPPDDLAGHLAFAASVAPPDVFEAIAAAEPLRTISTHRFPDSIRRRYDRLPRFPQGLLVTGDAVCSFNPTYGQGMTVAAAEAVALRECLAEGERDLARRFFRAAAAPTEHAWTLSTGADLSLPHVAGRRPLRVRAVNAYLGRLRAVAEHDDAVAAAFIAVVGMRAAPPTVLRPAVAARVLRGPRARWVGPPEGVRSSVLEVAGVRTPLREAGPADADEAVVFLHGNPGSSANWEPLLAAVGRARLRAGDRARRLRAERRGPRRVPRRRRRRARHPARASRRARLRRPVGPALGGRAPRPLRERGPAVHRGARRLPLARARPAVADARGRRAVHGHDDRPGLPGAAAARQPSRPAAWLHRPHVPRFRPRDAPRRARALPLRGGRGRRGRGARRGAAAARPPRARAVGPRRLLPGRRGGRAPARGVPERRGAGAGGQRTLAVRRRPRRGRGGAAGPPRPPRAARRARPPARCLSRPSRRRGDAAAPEQLSGRGVRQRALGQHARQVALVVRGGVEVGRRVGALGGLLGGRGDRVRVERPAAQRLLDRGRPQRDGAHVGEPDPHVLAGPVGGLLDQRANGHHRPVLIAAVELVVAEPVAVHRRQPHLREHLPVADRGREVVLEQVGRRDLAVARVAAHDDGAVVGEQDRGLVRGRVAVGERAADRA